ncbi:MAG: PilZ domain-containing protein [Vicinamibacterales bacterium]
MTDFHERRAKPRLERPFPVTLRGVDAMGEALNIDTVLDNLSPGGLYVRIPRRVEPGAKLSVAIRLSEDGVREQTARLATRGVVLRVESTPNGEYGVALAFTTHRIF